MINTYILKISDEKCNYISKSRKKKKNTKPKVNIGNETIRIG